MKARFSGILHNLVGNAKSVGADKVEITVWRAGQLAIIDIADNGPGMDAKARADMFKPFSGSTRGNGLGLSIARDIAVAHGGDLRLSRSNAIGSKFRIRLPLSIHGGEGRRRRWWQ